MQHRLLLDFGHLDRVIYDHLSCARALAHAVRPFAHHELAIELGRREPEGGQVRLAFRQEFILCLASRPPRLGLIVSCSFLPLFSDCAFVAKRPHKQTNRQPTNGGRRATEGGREATVRPNEIIASRISSFVVRAIGSLCGQSAARLLPELNLLVLCLCKVHTKARVLPATKCDRGALARIINFK